MRLAACLTLALLSAPASAQITTDRPRPISEPKPTELPIARVALYKNGVGFFEHAGRVIGDQAVTIDFTSAQLNDVLQSLTAIDLNGGRIAGAGYNSTTPLEQQLKTLPLALSDDPSDVDFYNAIRGARVQVSGPGIAITGRLLAIDLRGQTHKNPDSSADEQGERRFVTVVSDTGAVRTVELTSAVSVILLDTALHTDVTRYLELLAGNRNQGLRHLTLLDRGTGSRDLRVSYISEVPVWKSTYRILFTDSKAGDPTATLQGWSVVDNTTGSDWTNVHLDLIAGAPQSFIQPLSTPYYNRRPEIPLPSEAQLSPQTHVSGDADSNTSATVLTGQALAGLGGVNSAGMGGRSMASRQAPQSARLGGVAGGMLGGYGTNGSATVDVTAAESILETGSAGFAAIAPSEYQLLAQASLNPQTTTAAYDDFFEYSLTDPITIRKNESALVPILQTKLPIERVTLWSQQQPVALRALWLTNSSILTLDRGSFSIVENGSFGGEGLLDPIHPGEKRLLSYAADQAVHITISHNSNTSQVNHLKIAKGVLTETSTDVSSLTYDVRNAAPDPRTVIVEHPIRQGWTLDTADSEGKSTPRPDETTPATYRFRIAAAPSKTTSLQVSETHTNYQFIRLVDQSEDQLVLLLRNAKASPATLAALQPVFDAHRAVLALDDQIRKREVEIGDINKDQARLRENMKALKGSPEEKALLTRYTGELNSQEDRLAALNTQIAQLQQQRAAADTDFQAKLEALTLDESI